MQGKSASVVALVATALCGFASIGRGDSINSYTFELANSTVITSGQSSVIGSQIKAYIKDNNGQSVTFHFENLGSFTDCVTEIYFQDGKWLTPPPTILSSNSGVNWEIGANPGHLPGATNFVTDTYLSSQSDPGNANGINNNPSNPYTQADWLDLTFTYMPGIAFGDVVNALDDGQLEVGFHVTGYYSSASVIESGTTPVPAPGLGLPLPASVWGCGALLGLIALARCQAGRFQF